MTHDEATKLARKGSTVSLVSPDTTGAWFDRHPCWLDSDGGLVMPHPTENTGTVLAPLDGNYSRD